MAEAIELKNITKQYPGHGKHVVKDLNLDISRGEIVMLIGPSGCGKTTTLKMMNRLIEPTSGSIFVNGADVTTTDPTELRRSIGYVIQQVGLFPHLRVGENVSAVLRLLKWPKNRITQRVDEMLDLVGLDPSLYRDRFPKELSGGQKQRVGVARALAADPLILLMDEPFGAVDPITRSHLQAELLRLQREIQKTIVCVTHDIDEAVLLGDKIAVFGTSARIEQYAAPAELLSQPANEFVENFIGGSNSIRVLSLLPVTPDQLRPGRTVDAGSNTGQHGVLDEDAIALDNGRPAGWVFGSRGDREITTTETIPLATRPTYADALDLIMKTGEPGAIFTHADGAYAGILELGQVHAAIATTLEPAPMMDAAS
ncbi:ABC transporter ATP-binding protein [Nocardia sp. NPDC024068]|uniref:ABC transporter ATP-binding protein n=1 Tax=Nocardia sp. NPDC024068 TaxID=3157197 RepID=UPI0033FE9248